MNCELQRSRFEGEPVGRFRAKNRSRDGSAVLVVLILLSLLVVYSGSNGWVLGKLDQDLRRIEQKQLRRYPLPIRPAAAQKPSARSQIQPQAARATSSLGARRY